MKVTAFVRRYGKLLQFVLIVPAVVLIAWRLDLQDAAQRFAEADLLWIPPAIVLFALSRFLVAYRWRMFMRTRLDLPLSSLTGIVMISNMVNMLVPARAGDVLRIELAHRRLGVRRSELASNVFATETIMDAAAFLLLILALLPLLDLPLIGPAEAAVLSVIVVGVLLGALMLARMDAERDFTHSRLIRWLPGNLQLRVKLLLPGILYGFASLRRNEELGRLLGLSVLLRLIEASAYWMIGLAFGLPLGPLEYVAVMVVVGVIVTVPLFPSNIGPYEIAVAELVVLFGATRGDASAYAIGSHLLLILWAIASGLTAMWLMRMRPGALSWRFNRRAKDAKGA